MKYKNFLNNRMRYIKVYENYNIGKPNLGNYVICWKDDIELNEFLSKNIGIKRRYSVADIIIVN